MSDLNAGGMLSAREVLTALLRSFNRSTMSSTACNGIAIKDMLVNRITIFNSTLAYKHYYTIDKIVAAGAYPKINTLQTCKTCLHDTHIIWYCWLVPPTCATGCNAMRQTSVPFHFTLPPTLHRTEHRTTKQQSPCPTPYLPTYAILGDKLTKNICIYLLLAIALSQQILIYQFAGNVTWNLLCLPTFALLY